MKKFFLFCLFFLVVANVSALSLVVHVPEKYVEVEAGERVYFEVDVKYPENLARKDLRLEYEIFTEEGTLVSQSKAIKAIETQASFIDFIVIPDSATSGVYLLNVKIKDYESLSEEVGASFHVHGSGSDQILVYLIIILVSVIMVGILVVVGLFRK